MFTYPFLGFGERYRQEIAHSLMNFMLLRLVALGSILAVSGIVLLVLNLMFRPHQIKICIIVLVSVMILAFIIATVHFFNSLSTMG